MLKFSACRLLFSLSVFGSLACQGQELVGSQGGILEGSLGSLSWSLGEPVIETASNAALTFSQGFQQNFPGNAGLASFVSDQLIEIYPNPTHDQLTIDPKNHLLTGDLYITDATGRVVYQLQKEHFPSTIYLGSFAPGMYFVIIKLSDLTSFSLHVIKQ
jgi:hypothetical protein